MTLREKAKKLAEAELAVNGGFLNRTWKVVDKGEVYVIRVRMTSNGQERLVIERPVHWVDSFECSSYLENYVAPPTASVDNSVPKFNNIK